MVFAKIRQTYNDMFQAEKKVADYILDHPKEVLDMNISELAKESNTSDATIIRMCKHIGYTGFYQLKISLASSVNNANESRKIDKPEDIAEYFEKVASMLKSVVNNIDMGTLAESVKVISRAGTVYTTGWGNTNEIASDLAHRLTRLGIRSFNSDIPEYTIRSLGLGNEQDVVVAVSHSGEALHVIDTLGMAREWGMKTILITNNSRSTAAGAADYILSTDSKEISALFEEVGGESHILELIIVDAVLYFLQKNENMLQRSDQAEFILSHYKV